jgi:hypothetical protein
MSDEGAAAAHNGFAPKRSSEHRHGAPYASTRDQVASRLHRHRRSLQDPIHGSPPTSNHGTDPNRTKRHKHRSSKVHHHIKDALQTTIPGQYQDISHTQMSRLGGLRSEDTDAGTKALDSQGLGSQEDHAMRIARPIRAQDVEKEKWRQKMRDE